MSGEDDVAALIGELRATKIAVSKLTDEVARLGEMFSKMLSAEPRRVPQDDDASPFAKAAGGLIEGLVMGRKRKGRAT